MFKPELCNLCGDCLMRCQWIETDREQAVAWRRSLLEGKDCEVLERCITCYACNEYCPEGANPFDRIAELQEQYHRLLSADALQTAEARYVFSGELRDVPQAETVMSTCVFSKTDEHLIQGELYDLPKVSGRPYFCWVMFSHMGGESIQRRHAAELVDRLASTGAREIVCFHDDCYAMLARLAPDYGIEVPFRPVHLAEYLVDYLKRHSNRLRPLNLAMAYQRPCASRFTPEKEPFIDELFALAGVQRVERTWDRENALCCAGVKMMLGKGDPKPDQVKNIGDAQAAGARAMVCLCPVCIHSLSMTAAELSMPLIFIGDLARMALGEIDPPTPTL
jgi:Fe-S oxidoreductase